MEPRNIDEGTMQAIPKVAAICVNWNGKGYVREALESVLASDYPRLDLLVVDNGSSDGSAAEIPPGTSLLQLAGNYGYGEALNRGIEFIEKDQQESPPTFYLALNNDLYLEKDTVSALVRFAQGRAPGITGPAIVQADNPGNLEAAWGEITWSHVLTRLRGKNAEADSPPWNEPAENVVLLGSVMLIHRDLIDAGIRFDPLFFMYHEEVDFIRQAARKRFSTYYFPGARANHLVGKGTRNDPLRKTYWIRRNTIYFLRKEKAGAGKWIKCLGTMVSGMIYAVATLRLKRARAIGTALLDGFRKSSENQGKLDP